MVQSDQTKSLIIYYISCENSSRVKSSGDKPKTKKSPGILAELTIPMNARSAPYKRMKNNRAVKMSRIYLPNKLGDFKRTHHRKLSFIIIAYYRTLRVCSEGTFYFNMHERTRSSSWWSAVITNNYDRSVHICSLWLKNKIEIIDFTWRLTARIWIWRDWILTFLICVQNQPLRDQLIDRTKMMTRFLSSVYTCQIS